MKTPRKKKVIPPVYHMSEGLFKTKLQIKSFFLASKSPVEKKWFEDADNFIKESLSTSIIWKGYEALSFKIPGGRYTPDWVYLLEDNRCICVEIKGSVYQRNYRATRQALRAAAALYSWIDFFEVLYKNKNEWTIEKMYPDETFILQLRSAFDDFTSRTTET